MVVIDPDACTGCNTCVEVCAQDVFLPGADGGPPVVAHGDECFCEGSCVEHCPARAIRLVQPLARKVRWKRKETGEQFRL